MKTKITQFTLSAIFLLGSSFLISCGGEKPVEDAPKTNTADLFKDDRPDFDPKAIDPAAEVVEIVVKGTGLTMSDMSYDPKILNIKAGKTIKLKFINTSTDASMPHNWVLVHNGTMEAVSTAGISVGLEGAYVPNTKDVLIATKLLGPGEETEIIFPAPPTGTYEFVCTYPGHWSIMNGKFIVE